MKLNKIFICFFAIGILFLTACSSKDESIYSTMYQNEEYIIDTVNQIISHNNATYWRKYQGNAGFGGWSDNYDKFKYVSGDVLINVLSYKAPDSSTEKNPLIIILFFVIGIWNTISPRLAWYLSYGWRYKNAEPSDIALGITRFGGIVAIIIGFISIFI